MMVGSLSKRERNQVGITRVFVVHWNEYESFIDSHFILYTLLFEIFYPFSRN